MPVFTTLSHFVWSELNEVLTITVVPPPILGRPAQAALCHDVSMISSSFRFDSHRFQSRMRSAFEPRKPRHRVVRFALGVVGLGLLALLVMFSVALGAAMVVAGLLFKAWRGRGRIGASPRAGRRVVDAEYRVVGKPVLTR